MYESINSRLKLIRMEYKKTQEEFGKIIGISKSGVSDIEGGRRNVTEQHIKFLVLELNVNEDWLRHGQGEMFIESDTFSLDDYAKKRNLTTLELDVLKGYMSLSVDARKEIMSTAKSIFAQDSEIAVTEEDPIEKELNAYRLELEAEKKGKISLVSEDTDAKTS